MATLQIRVEDSLKSQADNLFSSLGLDTSTAVRIFLNAAIEHNGISFPLNINPFLPLLRRRFLTVEIIKICTALLKVVRLRWLQCWRTKPCIKLSILTA